MDGVTLRPLERERPEAEPWPAPAPADTGAAAERRNGAAPLTKSPYPAPAALPTQLGPEDIRFDFNLGARVVLPRRDAGRWRVRLEDIDTGNVLFQSENQGAFINSSKRWFVRFRIQVWAVDESGDGASRLVLLHEYDARGRDVLIQFPVGTLGDTLAWFPAAVRFAEQHGARVTCAMSGLIIPLLQEAHPQLRFLTHEQVVADRAVERAYASYSLGLFFADAACDWQPTDFRHVGLHKTAAYILGVPPEPETPPRLVVPADDMRPIAEPYAVIAVQSTSGAKYWNNPTGWRDVVGFLKASGYPVVCIDQKSVHGAGLMWTHIPHGAQDETGDRPLTERARWLRHADLFVGLSSGLAWLAWAAGCPAVLISGFSHANNEFATPYRVINWHACNSCWNVLQTIRLIPAPA